MKKPPKFWRKEKLLSSTTGNLSGGLFTRDVKKWIKGALEMLRLSLRVLYKGDLEGVLLYWGPRSIC